MIVVEVAGQALAAAFNMLWEVLWPLALGFILSAIVQTLVSHRAVVRALGSDS
ncbi:MAG: permease, partial [Chloroflexi bacterium]